MDLVVPLVRKPASIASLPLVVYKVVAHDLRLLFHTSYPRAERARRTDRANGSYSGRHHSTLIPEKGKMVRYPRNIVCTRIGRGRRSAAPPSTKARKEEVEK